MTEFIYIIHLTVIIYPFDFIILRNLIYLIIIVSFLSRFNSRRGKERARLDAKEEYQETRRDTSKTTRIQPCINNARHCGPLISIVSRIFSVHRPISSSGGTKSVGRLIKRVNLIVRFVDFFNRYLLDVPLPLHFLFSPLRVPVDTRANNSDTTADVGCRV